MNSMLDLALGSETYLFGASGGSAEVKRVDPATAGVDDAAPKRYVPNDAKFVFKRRGTVQKLLLLSDVFIVSQQL